MVDEARHTSAACPDLEQWSSYVEASLQERADSPLTEHLSSCDHCFSTVAVLEQSLSSGDGEAQGTPPQLLRRATAGTARPARRSFFYAAAAAVAVILLGSWYTNRRGSDGVTPAGVRVISEQTMGVDERVFGFAHEGESASPHRSLVVFAGFDGESSTPPAWSQELPAAVQGMDGTVLPRRYLVERAGSLALLARTVLAQVDGDVDLGRHDSDDDGVVDYIFLVLSPEATSHVLAKSVNAGIGIGEVFTSNDRARSGEPVRIQPEAVWGCVVGETTLAGTAKAMANGFKASMDTGR